MTPQPLMRESPTASQAEGLRATNESKVIVVENSPKSKGILPSLHPLHYADLQKSGLSDETLIQQGIRSVRPKDIDRLIGYSIPGLISAYIIPFSAGYYRLKVFYASGQERYADGRKKPRYIQLKGSANRLYIPLPVFFILNDTSAPLYITEGEKKALKATQEGLPTIAITGLWNWKQSGTENLIPDFDLITWQGRTVYIIPDSDWLEAGTDGKPRNLKDAVLRLCWKLQKRGAKTNIVMLPGSAL